MTATTENSKIDETASLGTAVLIAETEDGSYQPVGLVSTIREAREFAAHDLARRMRKLEAGADPVCPAHYVVWAQDHAGCYATVAEIETN